MLLPTNRKTAAFTIHNTPVMTPEAAMVEGLPITRRPAVNEAMGRSSRAKALIGMSVRSRDPTGLVASCPAWRSQRPRVMTTLKPIVRYPLHRNQSG